MQNGIILRKSVSFVKKMLSFSQICARANCFTYKDRGTTSIYLFTANLSMTSLCIFRAKPQSSIKDI